MPKALAKIDGYKTLVKRITQEFAELELFVKNRVAKGYWNVGKYIDEHLLENKDKPEYASGFYEELAEDVGRDRTTLQCSVRFYRAYPIRVPGHELTWGHYRRLITVKDPGERKKLEEQILRKKWDTHKFQKYLNTKRRLAAPADDDKPIARLTFTRGRLHTCQIVPANKALVHRGPLALDLGFREQYEIPKGAPKLKETETVELVFRKGTLAGARKVEVPKDELFTYKAEVEKVIDGDTLLVSLDFNCPMSISQKLRLRGIDCPELDTEEGRRAKRFVESRLKGCGFIVVKTYKDRTDRFDRYLADVFYESSDIRRQSSETDDRRLKTDDLIYLNQELLNEHLAVVYE
ncbi:MAG: thermonuclease family protein [Candidatus Omnitrophica bacterium]|nr:thermonuclease family protein [Candidatus Omnitrophota bacterium]